MMLHWISNMLHPADQYFLFVLVPRHVNMDNLYDAYTSFEKLFIVIDDKLIAIKWKDRLRRIFQYLQIFFYLFFTFNIKRLEIWLIMVSYQISSQWETYKFKRFLVAHKNAASKSPELTNPFITTGRNMSWKDWFNGRKASHFHCPLFVNWVNRVSKNQCMMPCVTVLD